MCTVTNFMIKSGSTCQGEVGCKGSVFGSNVAARKLIYYWLGPIAN